MPSQYNNLLGKVDRNINSIVDSSDNTREIEAKIANDVKDLVGIQVVNTLPKIGREKVIYVISSPIDGENKYAEYIYSDGKYERIGVQKSSVKYITIPDISCSSMMYARATESFTFSASTISSDLSIISFVVNLDWENQTRTIAASNGSASLSVTLPSNLETGNHTVRCYAIDSNGTKSEVTVKTIEVRTPYVEAPNITSPSENDNIITVNGMTVNVSSFSSVGITDTEVALKVKITSDSAGNTVVVNKTVNSGNSCSFTSSDLSSVETGSYYIFARYEGDILGDGEWSNGVGLTLTKAYVNTPSISSPSANDIVYHSLGITVNSSAFSATGGEDTHASSDWQICSDSSCTTVVAEALNSNDKTSHTFSGLNLSDNTNYYIRVRYNGTLFGESSWSTPVVVLNKLGYVNAPNILTPATNAQVIFSQGVTISTDSFSTVGSSDTHASSDWKITSDSAGGTIVTQAVSSSDLTSHTFTNLSLTGGSTYYAWAKHNGTTLGSSGWSSGRGFTAKVASTTASGRLIYRHENNKGSVVEYDYYGTTRKVFVADAVYRGKEKFGTYGQDSSNPNVYTPYGKYVTSTGSSIGAKDAIGVVTDATLQSRFGPYTDLDMRTLCDTWMTYEGTTDLTSISGVPAVKMCRNLTSIFSDGCDLPDIYTLCVLFIEGETIDSLDPTVDSNLTKALGATKNSSGHGYMDGANALWSASEYGGNDCFYPGYNGAVNVGVKYHALGVVPCRQL